eukprot:121185_1
MSDNIPSNSSGANSFKLETNEPDLSICDQVWNKLNSIWQKVVLFISKITQSDQESPILNGFNLAYYPWDPRFNGPDEVMTGDGWQIDADKAAKKKGCHDSGLTNFMNSGHGINDDSGKYAKYITALKMQPIGDFHPKLGDFWLGRIFAIRERPGDHCRWEFLIEAVNADYIIIQCEKNHQDSICYYPPGVKWCKWHHHDSFKVITFVCNNDYNNDLYHTSKPHLWSHTTSVYLGKHITIKGIVNDKLTVGAHDCAIRTVSRRRNANDKHPTCLFRVKNDGVMTHFWLLCDGYYGDPTDTCIYKTHGNYHCYRLTPNPSYLARNIIQISLDGDLVVSSKECPTDHFRW